MSSRVSVACRRATQAEMRRHGSRHYERIVRERSVQAVTEAMRAGSLSELVIVHVVDPMLTREAKGRVGHRDRVLRRRASKGGREQGPVRRFCCPEVRPA